MVDAGPDDPVAGAVDVSPAWEQIELAGLSGTLMVIGAPDTGKSTLARYLYGRLCTPSRRVAFLDGDPGQSLLGPPATLTLALGDEGDSAFPSKGKRWRRFIGAVSPSRHLLPVIVGAARLVQAAQDAGADALVYDTSGLVSPAQGGPALKFAKVDLLRPAVVFGIQRDRELEPLLGPWRKSRLRIVDLRPSPAVRPRDVPTRQAHRAAQFARHFARARTLTVNWERLAVYPGPHFVFDRLVALEDAAGFTLGLGIVVSSDLAARQVSLLTPLASWDGVAALRLGDLTVDPRTFRDQPIV